MPVPAFTLQQKISLPCLLLGALLFGVSFGVTHWIKFRVSAKDVTASAGLWKACFTSDGADVTYCYTWTSDKMDTSNLARSWIHKAQALECLALIVLLGAVGSSVLYVFIKMKAVIITAFLTCFVSALFMIIGCSVFASDVNDDNYYGTYSDFDWAFGFNIVAAIFTVAAGIGLLFETFFSRSTTNRPT